jgi:hypothetical protein
MRAVKVTLFAVVAALTLAAAPASAHPFPHYHNHGFWGGPGLIFGLAAGAIAAGIAADEYCVRYVPVYDDWGNYVGRRAVNAC